jgi:hypothetical protein
VKALLLSAVDTITEVDVPGEGMNLLTNMAAVIGPRCDLIERVRTRLTQPHLGNLVLAVDESGLYHDLPVNVLATLLYNPRWRPPQQHGAIHGNALVLREEFNYEDGGMDFAGVRDGDVTVVRDYVTQVSV